MNIYIWCAKVDNNHDFTFIVLASSLDEAIEKAHEKHSAMREIEGALECLTTIFDAAPSPEYKEWLRRNVTVFDPSQSDTMIVYSHFGDDCPEEVKAWRLR